MHPALTSDARPPCVAVTEGFIVLQEYPTNYPLVCHTFIGEEIKIEPVDNRLYRIHVDGTLTHQSFYRLFLDNHFIAAYHPSLLLQALSLLAYTHPVIAVIDGNPESMPQLSYAWVFTDDKRTYVIGRVDAYEYVMLHMRQFVFVNQLVIADKTWIKQYGIPHLFLSYVDNNDQRQIAMLGYFMHETNLVLRQTPRKTL